MKPEPAAEAFHFLAEVSRALAQAVERGQKFDTSVSAGIVDGRFNGDFQAALSIDPLPATQAQPRPAFFPGDVVKLNSGGPEMTVSGVSADGQDVHCLWVLGADQNVACVAGANGDGVFIRTFAAHTIHLVRRPKATSP